MLLGGFPRVPIVERRGPAGIARAHRNEADALTWWHPHMKAFGLTPVLNVFAIHEAKTGDDDRHR